MTLMPTTAVACAICEKRRPRRYCPGVSGDICPICCGTERENTITCPLDCPYLREARNREPQRILDPKNFPNNDIHVTEAFLQKNEYLLILLAGTVAKTAVDAGNIFDGDVKQALEALTRTYRTLESGLVYETRPENPIAARIYSAIQERVANVRQRMADHGGVRDADVLGVLVFLQHLEMQHNNGRRKGRAFIDFLTQFFPPGDPQAPQGSGLIQA